MPMIKDHSIQDKIDNAKCTAICDRASKNGPSWHKLHVITTNLISWVLYNIFKLCKL